MLKTSHRRTKSRNRTGHYTSRKKPTSASSNRYQPKESSRLIHLSSHSNFRFSQSNVSQEPTHARKLCLNGNGISSSSRMRPSGVHSRSSLSRFSDVQQHDSLHVSTIQRDARYFSTKNPFSPLLDESRDQSVRHSQHAMNESELSNESSENCEHGVPLTGSKRRRSFPSMVQNIPPMSLPLTGARRFSLHSQDESKNNKPSVVVDGVQDSPLMKSLTDRATQTISTASIPPFKKLIPQGLAAADPLAHLSSSFEHIATKATDITHTIVQKASLKKQNPTTNEAQSQSTPGNSDSPQQTPLEAQTLTNTCPTDANAAIQWVHDKVKQQNDLIKSSPLFAPSSSQHNPIELISSKFQSHLHRNSVNPPLFSSTGAPENSTGLNLSSIQHHLVRDVFGAIPSIIRSKQYSSTSQPPPASPDEPVEPTPQEKTSQQGTSHESSPRHPENIRAIGTAVDKLFHHATCSVLESLSALRQKTEQIKQKKTKDKVALLQSNGDTNGKSGSDSSDQLLLDNGEQQFSEIGKGSTSSDDNELLRLLQQERELEDQLQSIQEQQQQYNYDQQQLHLIDSPFRLTNHGNNAALSTYNDDHYLNETGHSHEQYLALIQSRIQSLNRGELAVPQSANKPYAHEASNTDISISSSLETLLFDQLEQQHRQLERQLELINLFQSTPTPEKPAEASLIQSTSHDIQPDGANTRSELTPVAVDTTSDQKDNPISERNLEDLSRDFKQRIAHLFSPSELQGLRLDQDVERMIKSIENFAKTGSTETPHSVNADGDTPSSDQIATASGSSSSVPGVAKLKPAPGDAFKQLNEAIQQKIVVDLQAKFEVANKLLAAAKLIPSGKPKIDQNTTQKDPRKRESTDTPSEERALSTTPTDEEKVIKESTLASKFSFIKDISTLTDSIQQSLMIKSFMGSMSNLLSLSAIKLPLQTIQLAIYTALILVNRHDKLHANFGLPSVLSQDLASNLNLITALSPVTRRHQYIGYQSQFKSEPWVPLSTALFLNRYFFLAFAAYRRSDAEIHALIRRSGLQYKLLYQSRTATTVTTPTAEGASTLTQIIESIGTSDTVGVDAPIAGSTQSIKGEKNQPLEPPKQETGNKKGAGTASSPSASLDPDQVSSESTNDTAQHDKTSAQTPPTTTKEVMSKPIDPVKKLEEIQAVNILSETSYIILEDLTHGNLVVSVRGTQCLDDVVTDLIAWPSPYKDSYVHHGMLSVAKKLLPKVIKELRVIASNIAQKNKELREKEIKSRHENGDDQTSDDNAQGGDGTKKDELIAVDDLVIPRIVFTGHSMGAGVSMLMTMLCRDNAALFDENNTNSNPSAKHEDSQSPSLRHTGNEQPGKMADKHSATISTTDSLSDDILISEDRVIDPIAQDPRPQGTTDGDSSRQAGQDSASSNTTTTTTTTATHITSRKGMPQGVSLLDDSIDEEEAQEMMKFLRRIQPECILFAPPACLSPALSENAKSFAISVVNGDDPVPRLSEYSVNNLILELFNETAAASTRDDKAPSEQASDEKHKASHNDQSEQSDATKHSATSQKEQEGEQLEIKRAPDYFVDPVILEVLGKLDPKMATMSDQENNGGKTRMQTISLDPRSYFKSVVEQRAIDFLRRHQYYAELDSHHKTQLEYLDNFHARTNSTQKKDDTHSVQATSQSTPRQSMNMSMDTLNSEFVNIFHRHNSLIKYSISPELYEALSQSIPPPSGKNQEWKSWSAFGQDDSSHAMNDVPAKTEPSQTPQPTLFDALLPNPMPVENLRKNILSTENGHKLTKEDQQLAHASHGLHILDEKGNIIGRLDVPGNIFYIKRILRQVYQDVHMPIQKVDETNGKKVMTTLASDVARAQRKQHGEEMKTSNDITSMLNDTYYPLDHLENATPFMPPSGVANVNENDTILDSHDLSKYTLNPTPDNPQDNNTTTMSSKDPSNSGVTPPVAPSGLSLIQALLQANDQPALPSVNLVGLPKQQSLSTSTKSSDSSSTTNAVNNIINTITTHIGALNTAKVQEQIQQQISQLRQIRQQQYIRIITRREAYEFSNMHLSEHMAFDHFSRSYAAAFEDAIGPLPPADYPGGTVGYLQDKQNDLHDYFSTVGSHNTITKKSGGIQHFSLKTAYHSGDVWDGRYIQITAMSPDSAIPNTQKVDEPVK